MAEILGLTSEINRKSRHLLLALGLAASSLVIAPHMKAEAAASSCKGSECIGKDPEGMCNGDAVTVKTKTVYFPGTFTAAGQLDLRYSPYCEANWGKFTAFQRGGLTRSFFLDPWGIGIRQAIPQGRVTAWNPGEPSQPAVKPRGVTEAISSTTWTHMVDGTRRAYWGRNL